MITFIHRKDNENVGLFGIKPKKEKRGRIKPARSRSTQPLGRMVVIEALTVPQRCGVQPVQPVKVPRGFTVTTAHKAAKQPSLLVPGTECRKRAS